jgi:hypothetical protein
MRPSPDMRIRRRREQAATCLKALGIPLVLAGSVGVTYQRNAFNNGFMAISSPLVRAAAAQRMRASARAGPSAADGVAIGGSCLTSSVRG